jgi:hypothetical protein
MALPISIPLFIMASVKFIFGVSKHRQVESSERWPKGAGRQG